METPAGQQWFLRKHADGTIFGPLPFAQLAHWAASAQVAPNDAVSTDATTWIKAPMVPELGMDWIVEITSEQYYGPTTLSAINEFLRLEEIDQNTVVINACAGTTQQVRDLASLLQQAAAVAEAGSSADESAAEPGASRIAIGYEERIRELEEALWEERRALAEMEERYRLLEARHNTLVETAAASPP